MKGVLAAGIAGVLSLVSVSDLDAQGGAVGKEATTPRQPTQSRSFRATAPKGRFHGFYDGDPSTSDAPYVIAIAGNGEVWFQGYYITATNLLLFTDGAAQPKPASKDDATGVFPFGVQAPKQISSGLRREPSEISDTSGGRVTTLFGDLREIYAEGDVYIKQGPKVFQAQKAYINFIEDRSLIVTGEMRTDLQSVSTLADPTTRTDRSVVPVPLILRAAEIRGVAEGMYEAGSASLTTSTFARPGYHIAIDRMIYEEQSERLGGRVSGYRNRLVIGDVPVVDLPYLSVHTKSPLPLLEFRSGLTGRFGTFVETRWGGEFYDAGERANRAAGIDGDFSGRWFADLNLYSTRGVGFGGGLEYESSRDGERVYFGRTEFFAINDHDGDDDTAKSDQEEDGWRGRFKSVNRAFLPDGWQLDTEVNYISDRNFLREFFEFEFEEEKEPETFAYLKKIEGDNAVTALARFRLNRWQTQTQYLPQFTYDIISRPVARFDDFEGLRDGSEPVRAYWSHNTSMGLVDRQIGDRDNKKKNGRRGEEGTAFRVDNVDRIFAPFQLGNIGVDPYFENRLTGWAGDGTTDKDSAFRSMMAVGFTANTQFWSTDPDVQSEKWNINGLRHIVIPTLRYRWTFLSTEDFDDLIKYDSVENVDHLHTMVAGLLNRYQTKRRTSNGLETVDFLEYDIQQPLVFVNDRDEDDDIDTFAPTAFEARYRPDLDHPLLRNSSMSTRFNWNWQDAEFDNFRASFQTEPSADFYSRVSYSYSQRGRIEPTLLFEGFTPQDRGKKRRLNALTFEGAYQATRRWEFVAKQQFDLAGESGGGSTFFIRRSTADWMFELQLGTIIGAGSGFGLTVTPIALFQKAERQRFRTALNDDYDLTPIFDPGAFSFGEALEELP